MRSLVVFALLVATTSAYIVVGQANIIECQMCELAVRVIAPTLGRDVQGVDNEFVKECEKIIPGKVGQHECQQYADKEFGNIIKELESGTAPKDVCTKLKAC